MVFSLFKSFENISGTETKTVTNGAKIVNPKYAVRLWRPNKALLQRLQTIAKAKIRTAIFCMVIVSIVVVSCKQQLINQIYILLLNFVFFC